MDLKIQTQNVHAQTIEKLREAILAGVFQPGEKLFEPDQCERLGISRSSVREALRHLAAEKLVHIVPNRGPFIADIGLEEAEQIYHVRAMLEGEACFLYASRADDAGLAQMRQALAEFELAVRKGDAMERVASTARFYQVILAGCGNKVIAEMLSGLLARVNFLRARTMAMAGRARHSHAELKAILVALEARDARSARAAAVAHVLKACEAVRLSFEESRAA